MDGRIVVFPNDSSASGREVFLDIISKVSRESDGGLLGLAFHPDYEENGFLYLNYTAGDPVRKVVSRFTVDPSNPNRADLESEHVLLEIPLEVSGHNGGQIAFGPDRYSFDALTGDLWLGDVGAGLLEEIDIVEEGKNYGWNILEGRHCFDPPTGCNPDTLATPVWEYHHDVGRSVTGGYVYRGSGAPELYGKYIFGDYVNGKVWALSRVNDDSLTAEQLLDTDFHIVSFGVDSDDELYVVTIEDSLYRIRPDPTSSIEQPSGRDTSLRVYPNPSRRETTITYELPEPGRSS